MLKEIDADLEIHGLDCVQDRLDLLPSAYSRRVYGLSTDIRVDDQTFDVVVAGEFLEHLYPADVDKAVCDAECVEDRRQVIANDAESTLSKECTEEW
jgi:hypothetical protein